MAGRPSGCHDRRGGTVMGGFVLFNVLGIAVALMLFTYAMLA
jgi:hypothetical protein